VHGRTIRREQELEALAKAAGLIEGVKKLCSVSDADVVMEFLKKN